MAANDAKNRGKDDDFVEIHPRGVAFAGWSTLGTKIVFQGPYVLTDDKNQVRATVDASGISAEVYSRGFNDNSAFADSFISTDKSDFFTGSPSSTFTLVPLPAVFPTTKVNGEVFTIGGYASRMTAHTTGEDHTKAYFNYYQSLHAAYLERRPTSDRLVRILSYPGAVRPKPPLTFNSDVGSGGTSSWYRSQSKRSVRFGNGLSIYDIPIGEYETDARSIRCPVDSIPLVPVEIEFLQSPRVFENLIRAPNGGTDALSLTLIVQAGNGSFSPWVAKLIKSALNKAGYYASVRVVASLLALRPGLSASYQIHKAPFPVWTDRTDVIRYRYYMPWDDPPDDHTAFDHPNVIGFFPVDPVRPFVGIVPDFPHRQNLENIISRLLSGKPIPDDQVPPTSAVIISQAMAVKAMKSLVSLLVFGADYASSAVIGRTFIKALLTSFQWCGLVATAGFLGNDSWRTTIDITRFLFSEVPYDVMLEVFDIATHPGTKFGWSANRRHYAGPLMLPIAVSSDAPGMCSTQIDSILSGNRPVLGLTEPLLGLLRLGLTHFCGAYDLVVDFGCGNSGSYVAGGYEEFESDIDTAEPDNVPANRIYGTRSPHVGFDVEDTESDVCAIRLSYDGDADLYSWAFVAYRSYMRRVYSLFENAYDDQRRLLRGPSFIHTSLSGMPVVDRDRVLADPDLMISLAAAISDSVWKSIPVRGDTGSSDVQTHLDVRAFADFSDEHNVLLLALNSSHHYLGDSIDIDADSNYSILEILQDTVVPGITSLTASQQVVPMIKASAKNNYSITPYVVSESTRVAPIPEGFLNGEGDGPTNPFISGVGLIPLSPRHVYTAIVPGLSEYLSSFRFLFKMHRGFGGVATDRSRGIAGAFRETAVNIGNSMSVQTRTGGPAVNRRAAGPISLETGIPFPVGAIAPPLAIGSTLFTSPSSVI
jgi:hypothetical protein